MTPAKRQLSPQAIQKRGYQEKRDSTEDQGRESIPASEPGSSGDRGGSAGATGDGAACTSGESNNEEPQQGTQQQQATDPPDVQTHCEEPQSHLPSRTSSGAQTPTQSKKRKAPAAGLKPGGRPKLPRPEGVAPCPRCNSFETKFCYYNNYNIGQPRYFCKACQRYWTAGGTLRNVPVGAGRRKHKNHASRQQAKVGQDGSVQTHLPPQVHVDQYRIAMMDQIPGMAAGMHPALLPAVGMALPHMASTTLPASVFVPAETATLGQGHGSSLGPQNSRPGSSLGAGRSSNTLARLGQSTLGSRSLQTKTGNESNSNPSSAENNRSDEGSVHMRRRNLRTKSNNHAERGTGGNSDAGGLSHQKGTGSDPLPGSNTPSPPAAPSNGTLSHDSGALIPNNYTSFAFPPAGQQSGDGTSFTTRDGNPNSWMASSHQHHLHQSIANLQAQASLATLAAPPYGLQTWNPYGMYPRTCFPTWGAAAAYRCGVTGASSPTFNQPVSLALPLSCAPAAPSSLYLQVSQALGSAPVLPMQLYWTTPTAWPTCDTLQPSMMPASLPALDLVTRAQISTAASWQVDGGTSIAPQACNTAALPLPVMQGGGKDANGMVASGTGQMFTPWPAAALPFNSWAPETTSIPPWQQNWGQLPTSSGANSAQPFLMLPTMNTGAGGSGLSGSS